jgi:hypothetical protein
VTGESFSGDWVTRLSLAAMFVVGGLVSPPRSKRSTWSAPPTGKRLARSGRESVLTCQALDLAFATGRLDPFLLPLGRFVRARARPALGTHTRRR